LNRNGFTLLELLFVISVSALLGILIFSTGHNLLYQQNQRLMVSALRQALAFAKQTAISRSEAVSLCAAAADQTCGDNWIKGILIFSDPHNTGQITADHLLLSVPPLLQTGQLFWQGFLPAEYIHFAADGLPHGYHGSFHFLQGHTEQVILVMNNVGRIR
jgi:type IV fimbrial biogenesis protein FimT